MAPDFEPRQRLIEARLKGLGQDVPEPLHERIEQLCDLVYAAGEAQRPSKMQMVAAVLFGAPTDADELVALLRRYGRATVAEALVESTASADSSVIRLPTRRSGPRSPGRKSAIQLDSEDPS